MNFPSASPAWPRPGPYSHQPRAPGGPPPRGGDDGFARRHGSPYVRGLVEGDAPSTRRRQDPKRKTRARWPKSYAGGARPKRVWVNVRYADSMDLLLDLHTSLGVRRDFGAIEVWRNILAAFPILGKSELTGVLEASDSRRGGLVCVDIREKAGVAYSTDRRYFVFVLVPPREGETRLKPESLSVPVESKRGKKRGKPGMRVKICDDEPKLIPYEEVVAAENEAGAGRGHEFHRPPPAFGGQGQWNGVGGGGGMMGHRFGQAMGGGAGFGQGFGFGPPPLPPPPGVAMGCPPPGMCAGMGMGMGMMNRPMGHPGLYGGW